jgi:hypothetical protein
MPLKPLPGSKTSAKTAVRKIDEIDDEFGVYVGALERDLTNTPESAGLSAEERKAKDLQRPRHAASEAQSIRCAI